MTYLKWGATLEDKSNDLHATRELRQERNDSNMDQWSTPLHIMIFLRLKQLCFSPYLRMGQAALNTPIGELWSNPAFDWQHTFIKVFERYDQDTSLQALAQLKNDGFDMSKEFVETYDTFRNFIEKDFTHLSSYLEEMPEDWLVNFSSISLMMS